MQQYFVKETLTVGKDYIFTKEQSHHAGDVLHLDHERIRLVDHQKAYFAESYYDGRILKAHILEEDHENHDLPVNMTLLMSLIRREKFELVLQKASELGVNKVVPVITERTVVHIREEKKDKIMARWQAILQEAAEQCKRNSIPVLGNAVPLTSLNQYKAECNLVPYEKADGHYAYISELYQSGKTAAIVIGPEGGFSRSEIDCLKDYGYQPVTLGSRILRAETAALYSCSIIAEIAERNIKNELYDL